VHNDRRIDDVSRLQRLRQRRRTDNERRTRRQQPFERGPQRGVGEGVRRPADEIDRDDCG